MNPSDDMIGPTALRSTVDLARFARLAGQAVGCPAAAVAVSNAPPGLAGCDLGAPWFQAATAAVAAGVPGEAGWTVLHGARATLPGGPDWVGRVAHVPLRSAITGQALGSIYLLDPVGAPEPDSAYIASLSDLAGVMTSVLEQAKQHRTLLSMTELAGRADRMLRSVLDAGSCTDALTSLLRELCLHHGATIGRIWRLSMADGMMQELSRFNDPGIAEHSYYRHAPTQPVRAGNSMTAEAIRLNQPQAFAYATVTDQGRYVLMQAALDAGLRCQVSFPIWVQDQRFGVAMAFSTERNDLEAIVDDIASLANTIRPALLRKVTEDRIRFMAHHDELTQLSNRAVFNEVLEQAVAETASGGSGLALLYLDLDGFKLVNDTRGHEAGDKLLAAVAGRLRSSVREGDMVARLGGDEFAIIQRDAGQPYAATQLARRVLQMVGTPFDIDGQPSVVGVSIGIALHPSDGSTPDVLQRNADTALYEAKQSGRNTFRLFDKALGTLKQERLLIERDLRDAINGHELTMSYQPIRETHSLQVRGLEALIRWTHPTRGPLPPDRFVPLAEASGLILPLGAWALDAACAEAARWDRPVCLSVNFSPMQFRQPRLAQHIEAVLQRTGLAGARLDLEVTEGLLLDESGHVLRTMHELRELGIRITLDDFGTAYASLSYLRRFPFDRIKIDRSFIQAMCEDDGTLAIVQAILSLSSRLGLDVVAEGVETRQELEVLRRLDCSLVQGFLTGAPLSAQATRQLLDTPDWEALRPLRDAG